MTKEQPNTLGKSDHDYNYPSDSSNISTIRSGQIDVIIPAQVSEFDAPTARALLRLLAEVHRKRSVKQHPTTEEI